MANFIDMKCDIIAIECQDELKGFKMLSFTKSKCLVGKVMSRKVQFTFEPNIRVSLVISSSI